MIIEINNLTKFKIDKKTFSTVAKIVLKGENRERETISLAFVSKAEIKKLNKKFRQKNKSTDVLSFELKDRNFLGEVIICPEVVKACLPAGRKKNEEMLKVFLHGILHLCGYDHEKNKAQEKLMEEKQEKYLLKIKK